MDRYARFVGIRQQAGAVWLSWYKSRVVVVDGPHGRDAPWRRVREEDKDPAGGGGPVRRHTAAVVVGHVRARPRLGWFCEGDC